MRASLIGRAVAALVAASLLGGCSGQSAEVLRRHSYAPQFRYIDDEMLKSSMWRMADAATKLDVLMRRGEPLGAAERESVVVLLDQMADAAGELSAPEHPSNHLVVDLNIEAFLRDVQSARMAAQRDPPSYYLAGSIAGSCMYCHGTLSR
jgi:hypothetical protein